MSPAHVLEPTYRTLRERLLEGAWPIGMRLDASRLADDLGVSVTPVRDCLNRFAGERLVDFRPQEGYRVALLRERDLRDMFDLTALLLERALSITTNGESERPENIRQADHAGRTAVLFSAIASRSGNSALRDTVEALSARLHSSRLAELHLFADAGDEIADLAKLWVGGSERVLAALASYHARRREAAGRLIELLEKRPT